MCVTQPHSINKWWTSNGKKAQAYSHILLASAQHFLCEPVSERQREIRSLAWARTGCWCVLALLGSCYDINKRKYVWVTLSIKIDLFLPSTKSNQSLWRAATKNRTTKTYRAIQSVGSIHILSLSRSLLFMWHRMGITSLNVLHRAHPGFIEMAFCPCWTETKWFFLSALFGPCLQRKHRRSIVYIALYMRPMKEKRRRHRNP